MSELNSKKYHTRNEKRHIKNDVSIFDLSVLAFFVVLYVHPILYMISDYIKAISPGKQ